MNIQHRNKHVSLPLEIQILWLLLQRHLDRQAVGFPATKSKAEIGILKHETPADAHDREDSDAFRANLESTFDIDGFLRRLAVNTVIQNWDTYGRMSQNYYLYNDPGDHLLHWIPWDNNMALNDGREALSLELSETGVGEEGEVEGYTLLQSAEAFEQDLNLLKEHVTQRYQKAMTFVEENQ